VTSADASNGWVSGSDLNSFFSKANSQFGWNAGVMGWVWNDASTCQSWIQAIYSGGGSNNGVTVGPSATTVGPTATFTSGTATATTGSSTTGGSSCSGKADGWYCVDSSHFMYCPGGIVQSCAPGTSCVQSGLQIACQ